MSEDPLETLCKSCGMCCDGTLFRRALLKPEEVEPAKRLGLRVIQDRGFEQPCPAWQNSGCTVYSDRPSVCRSFICRLWARQRDEGGPLEPRLEAVRRVRALIAILDRHGFTRTDEGEVKFQAEGADAFEAMAAFGELMTTLEEDFARA
jgi:hypothetical protein